MICYQFKLEKVLQWNLLLEHLALTYCGPVMQYVTIGSGSGLYHVIWWCKAIAQTTVVLYWSSQKVRKKCVIIHHVHIILSSDPAPTGIEILPTSKYHSLSLFSFCNTLGLPNYRQIWRLVLKICLREGQNSGCLLYWRFFIAMWNTKPDIGGPTQEF